jgi:hypothetical protein
MGVPVRRMTSHPACDKVVTSLGAAGPGTADQTVCWLVGLEPADRLRTDGSLLRARGHVLTMRTGRDAHLDVFH